MPSEKKPKRVIPTVTPGQKVEDEKPLAADHPALKIFGQVQEALAQAEQPTPPTPPTSRTPPTPRTPPTDENPIAPQRDFTKVANSIVREVVPGGHFVGKSKQLYDCLYYLTRGAVVPRRSITLPKPTLMLKSGIGSERTLLKNLAHLRAVGLVEISYTDGKHDGNEYTVYLPEEVGLSEALAPRTPPTPPTPPHPRHARTELPSVPPVESGVGGVGSEPVDSTTYEPAQTLIQDYRSDDDEAFADLLAKLQQLNRELTGREPNAGERARWGEFADLIVAELKIAAARTGSVSSVPAFLTEHLRRRLWKKDKAQLEREAAGEPETKQDVDASKCPDCGGSGWWYPDGPERGVAKCRHVKLSAAD